MYVCWNVVSKLTNKNNNIRNISSRDSSDVVIDDSFSFSNLFNLNF